MECSYEYLLQNPKSLWKQSNQKLWTFCFKYFPNFCKKKNWKNVYLLRKHMVRFRVNNSPHHTQSHKSQFRSCRTPSHVHLHVQRPHVHSRYPSSLPVDSWSAQIVLFCYAEHNCDTQFFEILRSIPAKYQFNVNI